MRAEIPKIRRGLYAIVNPDRCGGRDPAGYAQSLLDGGACALQLRDKGYRSGRALTLARRLASLCEAAGALFVVNDRIDVALLAGAPAVHVGPDDVPLEVVRRALGPDVILGRSTNCAEEALAAESAGADYLAFGPLFPTESKTVSRLRKRRGFGELAGVVRSARCPVFAIGGLGPEHAAAVAEAGAAGVAIIGALARARDPLAMARSLAAPWRER